MFVKMFANPKARRPLARVTVGAVVTLAAVGAIGFGGGVAGAAPVLADDPVPVPVPAPAVPAPAAAGPAAGVSSANAAFQVLNSLLNSFMPGLGSIMPSDPSSLVPGAGSSILPGSTLPGSTLPGQTTVPGSTLPGQTTVLPGQTATGVPGQTVPVM